MPSQLQENRPIQYPRFALSAVTDVYGFLGGGEHLRYPVENSDYPFCWIE